MYKYFLTFFGKNFHIFREQIDKGEDFDADEIIGFKKIDLG
jgi:hypothetical protein